jgi:regulatory protein
MKNHRPKPAKTPNSELSPEKLEQRVRNVLLFQLGRSARTEHQLREMLTKREFPPEVFEPILGRFVEAQIIDDAAFARGYVASRIACGGRSRQALGRELRHRGVAGNLIDEALADIDSESELKQATELARKRLARMANLDETVARRRVLGFLQRRGYAPGVAVSALRSAQTEY